MTKNIVTVKCGLFRKLWSGKSNICIREGTRCAGYTRNNFCYTPSGINRYPCFVIQASLNNIDKLLQKAGKLKVEVEQTKDIYNQKYYE